MLSLAALPWVAAQRAPAAPALLLDDGRSVDHGSLDGAAAGVGAALSGLGVGPGDRVGILCANGLGFCAAYFGALRLAAVGAPLSTASPAGELAITLADARLRVVVADVEHAALAARAISAAGTGATRLRLVDSSARARLDLSLDTLVEHPSTAPSPCPAAHPAVLLATSGTTGEPRRAVHSHAGLLFNARAVAGEMLALRPDDVQLGALSPAHSFGMSAVLNASLLAGCSMAVLRRFDAAAAAEAIRRHRVTVVQAVPTMLAALVERLPARPRSVRVCVVSGAPLPAGLAEGVHDRLCERVIERYGLTEVSPLTMRHVPRDGGEEGDVGAPLWSVVVRVADGGEEGELEACSPSMFLGYDGDPRTTVTVLRDGFLRTGDIGRVGPGGRVRLRGRLKDVIVRGGNNVSAREIELVLETHPAVVEAAVVGMPDRRLGEEVWAAVVVPREGRDTVLGELDVLCRERLTGYKRPRHWRAVDRLPRTATGKVRKQALREQLA